MRRTMQKIRRRKTPTPIRAEKISPPRAEKLFVTCQGGLEPLLYQELKSMGLVDISIGSKGVFAPCNMRSVYLINYCSRLASRVLWPLLRFQARDRNQLYHAARAILWEKWISPRHTFAIDANVQGHPELNNSHFAALVVKDALCDDLNDRYHKRPYVDLEAPDVQFNLFMHHHHGMIAFDTSLQPLYKRGFRKKTTEAPLQESLAAALLMAAGYSGKERFCDPFCGSGTLLAEAAMIATRTPAGFLRSQFGFFSMPTFRQDEWLKCKEAYDQQRIPLNPGSICGADLDSRAIEAASCNLETLGFKESISLQRKDIRDFCPPPPVELVVTNPPFGRRLSTSPEVFHAFQRWLRRQGYPRSFFLSPETSPQGSKEILSSFHGGIPVTLFSLEQPIV